MIHIKEIETTKKQSEEIENEKISYFSKRQG